MQLERSGSFPRTEHLDVAQEKVHQFADAHGAVDMRDHLEQIVRRVGQLAALGLYIERAVLVAHRAGGNALRAVVERAEQRVLAVDTQDRRREFLWKPPDFP